MIFYILACIGLTFIIKYGSILNWFREPLSKFHIFKDLFSCSLCIGFWAGFYIGIIAIFIENDSRYTLLPLISAPICWLSDCIIGVLQSIEIYLDNKNK